MFAYVLFIAIVNVCLGFGVAIHARQKYDRLMNPTAAPPSTGGFFKSRRAKALPPDDPMEDSLPEEEDFYDPEPSLDMEESSIEDEMPVEEESTPSDDFTEPVDETPEPAMEDETADTVEESTEEVENETEVAADTDPEPTEDVDEETEETDSTLPEPDTSEEPEETDPKSESIEATPEDLAEDSELSQMAELLGQPLDSEETSEGDSEEEPVEEEPAEEVADLDAPPEEVEPELTESEGSEAAVDSFKDQVVSFQEDLSSLDSQLLTSIETDDLSGIEAHLASLREANSVQLESCDELRKNLDDFAQEMESLNAMGDKLLVAVEMEEQQITDTAEVMASVEADSDNMDACRQMREEASRLSTVNHHLRDTTQETLAVMARDQEELGTLDPAEHLDPQTGVLDRIGLEVVLHHNWPDADAGRNQLGVAMVDVDQLAQLNDKHGQSLGDRILKAVVELLGESIGEDCTVGRHAGQRFLVVFPEYDRDAVVAETERLRQIVELTHLEFEDHEYPVTISCAVTAVTSADSPNSIESRLSATMAEAKRYGRNRTFVHEGKCPRPVPSLDLEIEERTVTI